MIERRPLANFYLVMGEGSNPEFIINLVAVCVCRIPASLAGWGRLTTKGKNGTPRITTAFFCRNPTT